MNRGANVELATRTKDSTAGTGDRSSVMYLKFDISDANGVTTAVLNQAQRTELHMMTRNSAQLTMEPDSSPESVLRNIAGRRHESGFRRLCQQSRQLYES